MSEGKQKPGPKPKRGDTASYTLGVRLTMEERAKLMERADFYKTTASKLVRSILVKAGIL